MLPPIDLQPYLESAEASSLASVEACAAELAGRLHHLDVLMNNAGIMAVPKATTPDGFESQIGTNHLGHFALTGRPMIFLVPDLEQYSVGARGFLYPFEDTAPGPLLKDADQVVEVLRDLDALREDYATAYQRFNATYNQHQDGHAGRLDHALGEVALGPQVRLHLLGAGDVAQQPAQPGRPFVPVADDRHFQGDEDGRSLRGLDADLPVGERLRIGAEAEPAQLVAEVRPVRGRHLSRFFPDGPIDRHSSRW